MRTDRVATSDGEGEATELTAAQETALNTREAARDAGQPERDRLEFNAPIIEEITVLEMQGLRSIRELERHRSHPGEVLDAVRNRAEAKNRQIDQKVEVLRGQLIPEPI